MPYQIGIVGAGALTRIALAPALAKMPEARLAAVLDPNPEALAAIAPLCPADALLTTDVERFFAADLAAVHVATPNHLHEYYACRALAAGLATLVDKPIAHTVASGRRILAAAETGTPALIGYMAKHNAANVEALRLVAAGAIGAPLAMVAARLGWRKYDWRSRRDQGGLGCLADLGIYPVLTAADLFGADPVRVQASGYPVTDPEHTEVYAQATLWYDERRYLHFETSFAFDEQPASAEVSGYSLVGEEGVLQVSGGWAMNAGGTVDYCNSAGWHRAEVTPVDPYVAQYRALIACAAGAPIPEGLSLRRALTDLEILYAVSACAAASSGPEPIALRAAAQPAAV